MNSPIPPTAPVELDKSWDYAKRYANLLGPVPPRLSSGIKQLRQAHIKGTSHEAQENDPELGAISFTAVKMIDQTPSLKTPLYFAASALFPVEFKKAQDNTSQALLNVLGPGLFSALLSITYLYRRLGKLQKSNHWELLSADILADMEIGFMVGKEIEILGSTEGLLAGGIRYLAIGPLMLKDAEQYHRYKNSRKSQLDREFERERWGCEHSQIAAYLLQMMGISNSILEMRDALCGITRMTPQFGADLVAISAAANWIDCLKNGPNPEVDLSHFSVTATTLASLTSQTKAILEKGSSFKWMARGYGDPDEEKKE